MVTRHTSPETPGVAAGSRNVRSVFGDKSQRRRIARNMLVPYPQ